ncbi:MAG: response regulator [Holophaga sp.]|nr:response regulator [Holophaga sp.]
MPILARLQAGALALGTLAALGVLVVAWILFRRRSGARERELEARVAALTAELRESAARLEAVFRHAPAAMAVKDAGGHMVAINKRAEALIGVCLSVTPAEAAGQLFPAGEVAQGAAQDERVLRLREVVQAEETVTLPGGQAGAFLIEKFPIVDALDQGWGLGIIATDITGRRHGDQAQFQSQKLESLGLLAGGIAHDFNNLLGAMLGIVELAAMEQGPMDHLRALEDLIARATGLVSQILAYAGKGKFHPQALDLNHRVEEVLDILRTPLQARAHLRWIPQPGLPPMHGDVGQVQQVIINLVMNAAEAMEPHGGVITIRTAREEFTRAGLDRHFPGEALDPGPYVVLEVADNGQGMAPELKERIFEPFFTTKFAGRGLGLSAVQGILRSHQGGIQVVTEAGSGSTFRLVFPALPGRAPEASPPIARPDAYRGCGLILVVDDEDAIRTVAARALQRLGFATLEARDGLEALLLAEADGPRIRLVLMDLTMPHLGGEDACRGLRRAGSIAPILLTSGYSPEEARHRLTGTALAGFLQKPYRLEALVASVRNALEGDPCQARRPSSRELASWAGTLQTGLDPLDTQHRDLAQAFDHLSPGLGGQGLARFVEALERHYLCEEEIMTASDFPFRRPHAAAHARLLKAFRALEVRLHAGEAALTPALLDAMEDAILNHLQAEDMELAMFLRRG